MDDYMEINADGMKFTQEGIFTEYIKSHLTERGINIDKDDYYKHPRFAELYDYTIMGHGPTVTEAWWIEKNFVGQERLEKIYGPYAMCCKRKLTSEECEIWKLCKSLANHLSAVLSEAIGEHTIYRKIVRDDDAGIPARLKKYFGIDIENMGDKTSQFRLLYLIAMVEIKYNVYVTELLQKPTLQNVDNSFVGRRTRNGEIIAELKRETEKALSDAFVTTTKKFLSGLAREWEQSIKNVRLLSDYGTLDLEVDNLAQMYEKVLAFQNERVDWKEYKFDASDGLIEGFYVLLSAHENIGRELDLIDIADQVGGIDMISDEVKEQYINIAKIPIKKVKLYQWAKDHRSEYAALAFDKQKASSNEYRKYDDAINHLNDFLLMLNENTKLHLYDFAPALIIIAFVQVYSSPCAKEKIKNPFFRYNSKDMKSFRSEMKTNTPADPVYDKSQMAWVELVLRRYNMLRLGDLYEYARSIEQVMDRLMVYSLCQGNLHKIRTTNELMLTAIQALTVSSHSVNKNIKLLEKTVRRKAKPYKVLYSADEDNDPARMFFSLPSDNHYEQLAKGLQSAIYAAENEQRLVYYDYDLEVQRGYLGIPIDLYFEIIIDPFTKSLEFTKGQVKSREPMQTEEGIYI